MSGKQPKRIPRHGVDEYGRTSLVNAIINGDEPLVKKLIAEGADINHQDDNGWSALHFVAQERKNTILKLLLSCGANPDLLDLHGNTPLWTAVMNSRGDFSAIRLLIKNGAMVDIKNKHGKSPLDMAMTIKGGLEKEFELVGTPNNFSRCENNDE